MGERRGVHRGVRREPLREAALLLGFSKDAVRHRIRRGTLRSDKGEDDRAYVYVDAAPDDVHITSETEVSADPRDQVIEQLRSEVEAWSEEPRRKNHNIAGFWSSVYLLSSKDHEKRHQASEDRS